MDVFLAGIPIQMPIMLYFLKYSNAYTIYMQTAYNWTDPKS